MAAQPELQQDSTAQKAEIVGRVIDHLVDALGGEPACTLRRAIVFADIDQHPGTTQADIAARLGVHKSALLRDIEWLYDYGCLLRAPGNEDGRTTSLRACGYAKRNLDLALGHFGHSHENLKNFLTGFINIFKDHKPTLRDAKIIAVVKTGEAVTRQEIFDGLYNGPSTTDNRSVNNLINFGLVQRET